MKYFIIKKLGGLPPPGKFLALLFAILLFSTVDAQSQDLTKPITDKKTVPVAITQQKLDSILLGVLEKTQNQTLTAMQLQGIYALFSHAKANEIANKQENVFADLSSYKSKNIIPLAVLDLQYEIPNPTNSKKSTTITKNYFAVSPLSEGAYGLELQFILPKTYLVKSSKNPEIHSLEVDFADGKGYQILNIEQVMTINYENAGFKKLQFQYQYKNKKGKTVKKQATAWLYVQSPTPKGKILNSSSKIVSGNCYECLRDEYVNEKCIFIAPIPDNTAQIANLDNLDNGNGNITDRLDNLGHLAPDETFVVSAAPRRTWANNGGMARGDAFLFKNCEGKMKDPIVIVECFDEKNRQGYEWGVTLFEPFMKEVLKRGYSVVLVNFRQLGDYIENNDLILREVLQKLRQDYGDLSTVRDFKEFQAVIGQSMGGQVARYELRKMQNDFGGSNVKNYISLDSPHRGANIPLGMQWMLSDLRDQLHIGIVWEVLVGTGFHWLITLADETRDALYWPSARQMIKHHIGYNAGSTPSATFNEWQSTINAMGFPQRPRNIAIVNGDLFGRKATDLVPLLGQKVIEYEWETTGWWGFVPYWSYSEGYAHFSPPANQNSTSRTSFVYMRYVPIFGYVSQERNSVVGIPGYDATVGSYYETQKEVKLNLQRLIEAGATITLTNNVDRHTFIPSNSAANFEPPAGVDENSDAYLETSLVNQNVVANTFPYQVLDANRIKGFEEVHPGADGLDPIKKGNIWHLDTRYLENRDFINKYFPEFVTQCKTPETPEAIGIFTDEPYCMSSMVGIKLYPVENATHYSWYVNGIRVQEFGTEKFYVRSPSPAGTRVTVSAVACSWFTNDCSRPIDISFVSARCRFLPSLVYPNPAENTLKIETTEAVLGVKVTNAFGQLVYEIGTTEQRPIELNLSNLINGVYFVHIMTNEGIVTEKIVIQK